MAPRRTWPVGAVMAALLSIPAPAGRAAPRCTSGHRVERCSIGGVRGTRRCETRCERRAPRSADGWFCQREGDGWRCTLAMP